MAIPTEKKMSEKNFGNNEFTSNLPLSEQGLAFSKSEERPSPRDLVNYKATQLAPEKTPETPR